jgi:hypothetical protein
MLAQIYMLWMEAAARAAKEAATSLSWFVPSRCRLRRRPNTLFLRRP